jgi:hypothetical protein
MNSTGTASNGSTRAPCMIASGFAPPGQNVSCRGIRHGQANLPNHASSLTPTLKHSFTHSQCDSLTQLLTLNPVPTDHFHSHSVTHPQFCAHRSPSCVRRLCRRRCLPLRWWPHQTPASPWHPQQQLQHHCWPGSAGTHIHSHMHLQLHHCRQPAFQPRP